MSRGHNDDVSSLRTPDQNPGWLSDDDLARVRANTPVLYVEAVPVRTDGRGRITEVGMLLRVSQEGRMTRSVVSGRVLHGEAVRDALMRHLEKDLGTTAFPQVPMSITPFTVAEYFPWPGVSSYSDTRQHAVSLAYVVPVTGNCDPRQDALELTWLTPAEAVSETVSVEMEGGRGRLMRLALASVDAT